MKITNIETIEIKLPRSRTVVGGETLGFHRSRANFLANPLTKAIGPEKTALGMGPTWSRDDLWWTMSDEGFKATYALREAHWEEYIKNSPSDGGVRTGRVYKVHTDEGLVGLSDSPPTDPAIFVGRSPFEFIGDDTVGGFQMALYDLMGKYTGLPAASFLGPIFRRKIPVSYWSGCYPPEVLRAEAQHAVNLGFRAHKIKRRPLFDIIEQVEAMSEVVPEDYSVIIDSNASFWTSGRAIEVAKHLERFPIVHGLETPIPQNDVEGYKRLRSKLNQQIILDRPTEYWMSLTNFMCDGFKLGDPKKEGPAQIRRLATLIDEAGHIPFFIDSGSLGIGCAFAIHLAATIRNATLPHGVLSFLENNGLLNNPLTVEDGSIELPQTPGLGVELNEDTIKQRSV